MFKSSINEGWWTDEAKGPRSLIKVAVRTGRWRLTKKQEGEKPEQGYRSQNLIKSDQAWRHEAKSSLKVESLMAKKPEQGYRSRIPIKSEDKMPSQVWRREAWRQGNLNKVIDQEFRSSLKTRSQVKSEGGKPDGKETWKRLLTSKNDQDWSWEAWRRRSLDMLTDQKSDLDLSWRSRLWRKLIKVIDHEDWPSLQEAWSLVVKKLESEDIGWQRNSDWPKDDSMTIKSNFYVLVKVWWRLKKKLASQEGRSRLLFKARSRFRTKNSYELGWQKLLANNCEIHRTMPISFNEWRWWLMRLLAKKKTFKVTIGFKGRLMKTGENCEGNEILPTLLSEKAHEHWRRSFIKVAVQEDWWKLLKKCLIKALTSKKWRRMMIWRTTENLNQGCCLFIFMVKIPDG